MSLSFIKKCLHRIGVSMAHLWVWAYHLENGKIPNWLEIHIYNKDIELSVFDGKKVVIELKVVDDE